MAATKNPCSLVVTISGTMPIYVYYCAECDLEIEEMRPIALADEPMWCPACGSECRRVPALFAGLSGGQNESPAAATPAGKPIHRPGCPCCMPIRRKNNHV